MGGINPNLGASAATEAGISPSAVSDTRSAVRAVPRCTLNDRAAPFQSEPGSRSGPQSLPVRLPQGEEDLRSPLQQPAAVQRKSTSASFAPSLAQEGWEREQGVAQRAPSPPRRKLGMVVTTTATSSSSEVAFPQRPEGDGGSSTSVTSTSMVRSTVVWPDAGSAAQPTDAVVRQQESTVVFQAPVNKETVQQMGPTPPAHQQEESALKAGAAGAKGGSPLCATFEEPLPLQPEPWPDVPLDLASLVTAAQEATMQRISLAVGGTSSLASSVGQGDGQSNLISHGTSLGNLNSRCQSPQQNHGTVLAEPRRQPKTAVASTVEDVRSAGDGPTCSSIASSAGLAENQLVRSPVTQSPAPGKLLTIPPPDSFTDQRNASPAVPPVTQHAGSSPDHTNHALPTASNNNTGGTFVKHGAEAVYPAGSRDASSDPVVPASSAPRPEGVTLHPHHLVLYPEYPALTAEDFQVSDKEHGVSQLPALLSMIPEATEQESLSPPAQQSGSPDSSGGHMWNYMQDQFSDPAGNHPHQLFQWPGSHQPRLPLYGSDRSSTRVDQPLNPWLLALPKFSDLLNTCSLSDSSTLRSGRNTSSSGEMPTLTSQPQPPGPGPGYTPASGEGAFAAQRTLDEPDLARPRAQPSRGESNVAPSAEAASQGQEGGLAHPRQAVASADEDHFSSGDLFGSGPSNNPGFVEALRYRQPSLAGEQQQLSPPPPASLAQAIPTARAASPCMSRKNPNLRLDVTKPSSVLTSTPTRAPTGSSRHSRGEADRPSQSALDDSGYSTHTHPHGGDGDPFPFDSGISPLTASPLLTSSVKPSDARSRNGSGSSVSTPKSSTYDIQAQEWGECCFVQCCVLAEGQ